jgi:hypothetical protein
MPARFLSDALSGVPGRLNGQALGRFLIFSGADLIAVGWRHGDVIRVGRGAAAVPAADAGVLPGRRDGGAGGCVTHPRYVGS